ncbi:hypothetical protein Goarm_010319 [Gossypium armourianum]|uniref:Uncharacterized protein n=1 Tax=Gossypium armourianum TaxID=34283 RepID=A0A7J9JVU5_9ROSI|nr:hypothetical protein [Gossypium armourianum]
MKNMIPSIWKKFSTRIGDDVIPWPWIKLQQNSFKQNRLLVQCWLKPTPRRNTKKSWMKCSAQWILNHKKRNPQRLQSK